jgi:hypothetical protein
MGSRTSLVLAQRGVCLTRAITTPKVLVFRSAIGGEHNARFTHMLQQAAARDRLVVGMRNDE